MFGIAKHEPTETVIYTNSNYKVKKLNICYIMAMLLTEYKPLHDNAGEYYDASSPLVPVYEPPGEGGHNGHPHTGPTHGQSGGYSSVPFKVEAHH